MKHIPRAIFPAAHANSLTAANSAAKEKLAVVKGGERTAASVSKRNEIFAELEAEARFLKKHYLLLPPRESPDGGAFAGGLWLRTV